MRTVQMTLDDQLVESIDKAAKRLKTTRSGFTRTALRDALHKMEASLLEQKHRQGYEIHPVNKKEFSVWEKEQGWGDE
ncbi:MAG: ribbon-helix-helix protein, CopG family [Deltaproteobacteria bacterium]|nr:ribbon-helix-helix protein, CopG family [Deltaproteobacteria bacterium]MBM4322131.1 ribbon-helix-helix protein, CopG family [Deltaproteobacteria bacterium]MBM4347256.1 ribbon-helix-helix protein, CopG family [Deltaproteobacteria bacterium]